MKPASSATLAIMAAGQMKRIDLYAITLAGTNTTYFLTSHQTPVIVANRLYQTGYIITRGGLKQSAGLQVESMQLTISPNPSNATSPPLIAGYPLLQAVGLRVLDGARVLYSKMFLSDFNDTSPGAVPWFQGRVNQQQVNSLSAILSVDSDISMLNTQGPPNVLQKQCIHTLFDAGCTLKALAFQVSGLIGGGSTQLLLNTTLSKPDKYFTLGRLTFTSGPNATTPSTTYLIKSYLNSSGQVQLVRPLPKLPGVGDTFVALPGCAKTMAVCSNNDTSVGPQFNNLKNFRGFPFVPVPETLYSGVNTQAAPAPLGSDGGSSIGSPFTSGIGLRGINLNIP